jgi:hypothetical protein
MSDSSAPFWRDHVGQWHEGHPPAGWQQAEDGHWYPAPPPPPDQTWTAQIPTPPPTTAPTNEMYPRHLSPQGDGPRGFWANAGATYRRWPTWAQVAVPVVAVLFGLGLIGAVAGPPDEANGVEVADTSDTTATTERDTTTTTQATTTTTAPPTTTTTAAPPPPTTAAPPPPTTAAPAPAPPPVPAPSPGGGCDPNYSGCVPIASDVDCAGGSGNGPAYVQGPISVIGSDVYDLDSDNDGVACE